MYRAWEKIKEEVIKFDYRQMAKKTFRLPDGRTAIFEIKKERPVSSALALTADRKVLVVKQYRPGPEEFLYELPAGIVDEGQTPDQCMEKELLEETGYRGEIKLLSSNFDCAYSTKVQYNYLITNCQKVAEPATEENEFIGLEIIPLEKFKEYVRKGLLTDIETAYIGLIHLGETEGLTKNNSD